MSEHMLPEVRDSLQQIEGEQELFVPPMTMKEAANSREQDMIDEWTVYYGKTVHEPCPNSWDRRWYAYARIIEFVEDGVSIKMVPCSNLSCPSKTRPKFAGDDTAQCCVREALKLRREQFWALHKANAAKAKKYDALCQTLCTLEHHFKRRPWYRARLMTRVEEILEAFGVDRMSYLPHRIPLLSELADPLRDDEESKFPGFLSRLQEGESVPGIETMERPLVALVLTEIQAMIRDRDEEVMDSRSIQSSDDENVELCIRTGEFSWALSAMDEAPYDDILDDSGFAN